MGAIRHASELETFTPVEMVALLRWAPTDSPLAASMLGGPHWSGWTSTSELLRQIAYATTAAVSKGKPKPPPSPADVKSARRSRGRVSSMPGAVPRQVKRRKG